MATIITSVARRHELLDSLTLDERRTFEKAYAAAGRESKIRALGQLIAQHSAELNRRLRSR
ncbi:hypothetical protein [Mycobacteroides salmoniphilum]|uniref:hypothetical protein n=1 Tax=Mycobacteroides salmoniphilum TaxID=404941 RepID=UPI0009920C69|nr:hypothetical protein [Mycobacteroides salmoniphilum]